MVVGKKGGPQAPPKKPKVPVGKSLRNHNGQTRHPVETLAYGRDGMERLVKSYVKNSHSMGSSYTIEVGDDPTISDEVVHPSGCIQHITQQDRPRSSWGRVPSVSNPVPMESSEVSKEIRSPAA